ncbi:MAG: hypothetical protein E7Y34_01210 [Mycoplasma sp.]|nr:hypothetical protein [Mycoplasma sp.]
MNDKLVQNKWIDIYNGLRTSYDYLSLNSFDYHHSTFRNVMMSVIDEQRKKAFISRFEFKGDPLFSKKKQHIFFRMLFDYGQVCVYNPTLKVKNKLKSKLSDQDWEVITTAGLDSFVSDETINKYIDDTRVVMLPNNFYYDDDNRPIVGYAITNPRTNGVIKSVKVSVENAAFALANSDLQPMWWLYFPFNYQYGTIQTLIKKRLQLSDPSLVKNTINNNNDDMLTHHLFNVDSNILNVSPSSGSFNSLQQVDHTRLDIDKLLPIDLKKLSFGYDDKITDLMSALNEAYNHTNRIMGIRDQINMKHNSNIDNTLQKEITIELLDKYFKDQLEMFIEDYQKIFGIKLELVDHVETVKKEQIENEKSLAGRADMEFQPNKGGGDKNKKNIENNKD